MPTTELQSINLPELNEQLADAPAEQIIRWAAEQFGDRLVMTSSFGAQSAVMLHLVTRLVPNIPIVLIDTGYLFPETYRFIQQLTERLELNLQVFRPRMTTGWLEAIHGELWNQGPEGMKKYHEIVKLEPMRRALDELDAHAWLAGLRRQQTEHRSGLRPVERQDGRYKIHPILEWTTRDVHQYLKAHELPYHPLYEQGYKSIGDVHSTVPITAQMHERDGRFQGLAQECGLHLPTSEDEEKSWESSNL